MRSTTEDSPAPPRRFGLPRLADVKIRSKLGLILIVPVIALLAVATVRLVDSSSQALGAQEATAMTEFTRASSQLVYALQDERAEAAVQLRKDDIDLPEKSEDKQLWKDAAGETDEAFDKLKVARNSLDSPGSELTQTLDDVLGTSKSYIEDSRKAIDKDDASRGDITPYTAMVNKLRNVFDFAIDSTSDLELGRDLRATRYIIGADESSEQMRLLMLNLDDKGELSPERYRDFVDQLAARDHSRAEFDRIIARTDDLGIGDAEDGLNSSKARPASQFEDTVVGMGAQTKINVDHAGYDAAYDERHSASVDFIDAVEDRAVANAEDTRQAVVTQVLIEIALVLITLIVAVLLALVVARSLALSLRRLREGALEVAHVDLPAAVASMRGESVGNRTPDQVAASVSDPLDLDNKDEVGTVAGAFNTVHREAVRIAAEQAALRDSVSTMFVNLARRSQNLVDRLIGHLDRLERGEEDPDRLAELFQLDHLATRMRRNDENLLVLAGADSTRVERNSAQIGDVLRAAQSEVEYYTRIEFGTVLADAEVEAAAVNDIVHLIAELLDNATSFSPPDSAVVAEARQVRDEIVVRITDRGIGISEEQLAALNRQLSEPADVDISASRMMGLVVVSRLAHRYQARVTLHPGAGRGTVAEVVLPPEALAASAERGTRPSPGPSAAPRGTGEMPRIREPEPPRSAPEAGADAPHSLFEPLNLPEQEEVEPFSPRANGHRFEGDTYEPSPDDITRERPTELTGEIIAAETSQPQTPDIGPVALPMIRLDAAPGNGTPILREGVPPAWPAANPTTNDPIAMGSSNRIPAADETMELPIFREIESAWFKAGTPAPRPAEDDDAAEPAATRPIPAAEPSGIRTDHAAIPPAKGEVAAEVSPREPQETSEPTAPVAFTESARAAEAPPAPEPDPQPAFTSSGLPSRTFGDPPDAPDVPEFEPKRPAGSEPENASSSPSRLWRTAADHGWQVAAEVGDKEADEATNAGLPKRQPGERLVPGSVEPPPTEQVPRPRRDPEGVRGLLSAYHRGVQRGRGSSDS